LAFELNAIYKDKRFSSLSQIKDKLRHTNIFELLQNSKKANKKILCETDKCYSYVLLELKDVKINRSSLYLRLLMYDL
jgi:hypothetical protein